MWNMREASGKKGARKVTTHGLHRCFACGRQIVGKDAVAFTVLSMAMGIITVQGFGEETLFRGYVFGNLRKTGIPFRRIEGCSQCAWIPS
jgi:hypothetical protein